MAANTRSKAKISKQNGYRILNISLQMFDARMAVIFFSAPF